MLKMSSSRGKSPGWAALDLQNKQKQSLDAQVPAELFPPLPHSTPLRSSKTVTKNNNISAKPFSAVILPTAEFPLVGNKSSNITSQVGTSTSGQHDNKVPRDKNKLEHISKKLKELYSWADDSLIEDILAAVNNDFDNASASLKAMVSDEIPEEYKDNQADTSSYSSKDFCLDDKMLHVEKEASNPSSFPEACFNESSRQLMNKPGEFGDDYEKMKLMLSQFAHIPIEPEWEDDDVYLNQRKDALKMMRAASRHSKAAANSFMRGNHISAQQYSQQARDEWAAAEKLNEKASHEILNMRNCENGMWKLDLHGLHATEAVQALQERMREIESQVFSNGSLFPDSDGLKADAANLPSGLNGAKKRDEQASFKQTPMVLEVITGIGKHSRGEAALPGAVKSFLNDNRYRFDEARPGVIFVRPKFRRC